MKQRVSLLTLALGAAAKLDLHEKYVRAEFRSKRPRRRSDLPSLLVRAMSAQQEYVDKIQSIGFPDFGLAEKGWGLCDSATDVESRVREELDKPGATGQKAWNAMLKMAHGARSDGRYADFMARGSKEIERQLYTPKRGVEISYRSEGATSE